MAAPALTLPKDLPPTLLLPLRVAQELQKQAADPAQPLIGPRTIVPAQVVNPGMVIDHITPERVRQREFLERMRRQKQQAEKELPILAPDGAVPDEAARAALSNGATQVMWGETSFRTNRWSFATGNGRVENERDQLDASAIGADMRRRLLDRPPATQQMRVYARVCGQMAEGTSRSGEELLFQDIGAIVGVPSSAAAASSSSAPPARTSMRPNMTAGVNP